MNLCSFNLEGKTHHFRLHPTPMSTSFLPIPAPPPHAAARHHRRQAPPPPTHLPHPPDEPPPTPKTPTIRSRLSCLCREGQPHIARQLFDTLPRPTTVIWNTIIIGFICNNMPFEALSFYSRMKSTPSTNCDSYTYSSTFKACADSLQLSFGKAVHAHVLRSNIFASRIVYNSLLNMYSTCLAVKNSGSGPIRVDLVRRVFNVMKKKDVVSWNVIISWYVKTERFKDALMQFKRMIWTGIKPTPVSFVNVFPAASSLDDYRTGNALFGLLVKFGSEYVSDVFAVSSAISMYSQMGFVDLARTVFDGCLVKNVEVWNTMINGYVQNNCYVEALDLFVKALESEHTNLDALTYVTAVTAISQLQQLSVGQQLHAHLIKGPLAVSVTMLNSIIVLYSRCGLIGESFKVFEKMVERDIVSWNTMITALVQNGLNEEGLMLVLEMQKQGFAVDSVTATALLSSASNLRSVNIGKQTHAYLIRRRIQFEGVESYLIDMYAKCGLIRVSQLLFERNNGERKDLATWNSIISGNTQNGFIEEAFSVLRQMLRKNVLPNTVTLASVLPGCSQTGSIALGRQLHGFAVRHFLDENVFVGTALVDMYSKCGAIASAENAFGRTQSKNPVTYTNMILGYAQHGMGNQALKLFHSMQKCGVDPDSVTFVAVLCACTHAGLADEGLRIFTSMEAKYGVKPSAEHYCCLVDMLGRVGRLEEAFGFAEKLGKEGSAAVRAWGSLLASCRIHGRYEMAKDVGEILLGVESEGGMGGYRVLLSNVYADEGNWEDVDRVRWEMEKRGARKDVGCSWIEVGGSTSCFVSKDKRHEKCGDIYQMLSVLAGEMKGE